MADISYEPVKTAYGSTKKLSADEEAIKLYESYVIKHDYYYVYENLGYAHELLGNIDKAIECYSKTYQLNPKSIRPVAFFKKHNLSLPTKTVNTVDPVALIRQTVDKIDELPLKTSYFESDISQQENNFCIARVIGNDLYPRHEIGQSRNNLKFILEHERNFENLKKIWIVNRIFNQDELKKIISLLEDYNQTYLVIPFDKDDYKKILCDEDILPSADYLKARDFLNLTTDEQSLVLNSILRHKNNYLINNNGARNIAISEAKKYAKWVLPWDGNCFLTEQAWCEIVDSVSNKPWFHHFIVPMARVLDNTRLLDGNFIPNPVEEPQIIFRKDTTEVFNTDFCYGRRPKVEMLWHLGVPGKWDEWSDGRWDVKRRPLSQDAYKFALAGWLGGTTLLRKCKTRAGFY